MKRTEFNKKYKRIIRYNILSLISLLYLIFWLIIISFTNIIDTSGLPINIYDSIFRLSPVLFLGVLMFCIISAITDDDYPMFSIDCDNIEED